MSLPLQVASEDVIVKLRAGSVTITRPQLQELALQQMRKSFPRLAKTQNLSKAGRTPFKLSYEVLTGQATASKITHVKNVWSSKTKERAFSKFGSFFKKQKSAPDIDHVRSRTAEKNRVAKAIPSAPMSVRSEITSVSRYNTIDGIREALYQQSLIDKITPTYFDVRTFIQQLTTYHNIFRSRHGAPSLLYDYTLERAAQSWSSNLGSRKSCLVHEVPRRYGENLFYFGARKFPNPHVMAHLVTQSFYMEGVGYDYNRFNPASYYKTGHFTQLIWKASKRMGVGVSIVYHDGFRRNPCQANVPLYMIYVVVKYDPPGNFLSYDAYINNVRSPIH